MRMSALSQATGVPVATVKFYLREGLLPPGERTGVNQAEYSDVHVRRLRLVRALVEVGHVRLSDVGAILTAVDDDHLAVHDLLGAVQYALAGAPERDETGWRDARAEVDDYLDRLGWRIRPDAPTRNRLADAVTGLRSVVGPVPIDHLLGLHTGFARRLAEEEIASLPPADAPRAELAEAVVVGVSLYGEAAAALRLLAQEDASSIRYPAHGPTSPRGTGPADGHTGSHVRS
jgi:DNA-binding transcriptional MerR regulator